MQGPGGSQEVSIAYTIVLCLHAYTMLMMHMCYVGLLNHLVNEQQ